MLDKNKLIISIEKQKENFFQYYYELTERNQNRIEQEEDVNFKKMGKSLEQFILFLNSEGYKKLFFSKQQETFLFQLKSIVGTTWLIKDRQDKKIY